MTYTPKHRSTRRPGRGSVGWSRVVIVPFLVLTAQHVASGIVTQFLVILGLTFAVGSTIDLFRWVRGRAHQP